MSLDNPWIVATLNTIGWPLIQITISYVFTQLSWRLFTREKEDQALSKVSDAEVWLWENGLMIRLWKDALPDGASWFSSGFPKAKLKSTSTPYILRFIAETRRGELSHVLMLSATPIFYTFNPRWAFFVMLLAGMVLNLPCIFTQRYNRLRMRKLLFGRRHAHG